MYTPITLQRKSLWDKVGTQYLKEQLYAIPFIYTASSYYVFKN